MKKDRNLNSLTAVSAGVLTLVVYFSALRNDFVDWDDGVYVFNNLMIRSFNSAFLSWSFFHFYAGNWHPLTWISHAVDYAVWGLNPFGHHMTNILLHAVNTFLVALLVRGLLELAKERAAETRVRDFLDNRTILISATATGLLFGLHPAHVESAVWVSERKDLLCGLFFLLSLIMYRRYVRTAPDRSRTLSFLFSSSYLAAFVFFILALLSKPMAVTLPVVLLILDWYPFRRISDLRSFRSAAAEKVPFGAGVLFSSLVTLFAQAAGGSVSSFDLVPLAVRIPVAAKAVLAYLLNMAWPLKLLPFYQYPDPDSASFGSFHYLYPAALVVSLAAVCVLLRKKQPLWLAAWSYYITTLIPVIGIVQIGPQAMADRYTYLPSIGPFLLIAIPAAKLFTSRKLRMGAILGASFIVVSLSFLTIKQIGIWKNTLTLWNYVIDRSAEEVPLAYNCRGEVFRKKRQPDRAIADFDKALSLNPGYYEAYNNRGMAFDDEGRFDKAIDDYEKAIALQPSFYKAYTNMGVVYGKEGQPFKALGAFNKSLAINPDFADGYYNRAITYEMLGQFQKALDDYSKAILLAPRDDSIYFDRGKIYLRTRDRERALLDFQRACELGNGEACIAARSSS